MSKKRLIPIDSPGLIAFAMKVREKQKLKSEAKAERKAERKSARTMKQAREAPQTDVTRRPLICALCGAQISPGSMLEHKESAHGERKIVPSPVQPHNGNQWVSVAQGGLPSLGKRSR